MKRNLFAIFLVVALVAALVFFVAPSAKAADSNLIVAEKGQAYEVNENGKTLDINGLDVTVTVSEGITLSVINTAIREKGGVISNEGSLTVNDGASIAVDAQAPDGTHFLAIGTTADGVTTYKCYPFNLAISKAGINTLAKNPDEGKENEIEPAICLQASFMAFKPVIDEIDSYGFIVNGTEHREDKAFAAGAIHRIYGDLQGSLRNAVIDNSVSVQAYIKINGVRYESSAFTSTPREILKTLNKKDLTPTDAQEERINTMIDSNDHLADLFTSVTKAECTHSAKTDATCVKLSTCKNCDVYTEGEVDLIHGHHNVDENHLCADCKGYAIDANSKIKIPFDYSSPTWELSGTINRANTGALNFGFIIEDENGKTLELGAQSYGVKFGGLAEKQFESSKDYGYYGYHATERVTQYNLNNEVQIQFANAETQMHFKAMIVDDVFYVWFWFGDNDPTLCWYIPLTDELSVIAGPSTAWTGESFKGFEEGSSYSLTLFNYGANPAGSFTDLTVKTGNEVDTKQVPEYAVNISKISIDAGGKAQLQFAGNSAAWELSGTINRDNLDTIMSIGFLIGDGTGKTLELNAHNIGFVIGGRWAQQADTSYDRYEGHSNGTITDYHLDNVVQRQFTREADGEDTQLHMHFRAMIVDDAFYVWFWFGNNDPTLCWRVPLTETLKIREGDTTAWNNPFTGLAGGSYTLKLFNNGGNPAGSFTDLSVKTGDDVDFSKVPPTEYDVTIGSTTTHGTANGSATVNLTAGAKAQIQFAGSSATWELSGTINRTSLENTMNLGFIIGDGTKTLELNAYNYGFVIGAIWADTYDYSRIGGYSTSTAQGYRKTNTVQQQFTSNTAAEVTQKNMHFKAMIVDDVFYVWFWFGEATPTLCWKIPLTETLTNPDGSEPGKPFTGFTGDSYTLKLFNNGGHMGGSFTNLYAKTGSAVDTTPVDDLNN